MGFDAPDFDASGSTGHVEMPPIEKGDAFTQFADFQKDPEAIRSTRPPARWSSFPRPSPASATRTARACRPGWSRANTSAPLAPDELHLLSYQPPTRLHSQMDPGPIAAATRSRAASRW
jgi:biotin/methionine sulfoxide reductase